MRKLKHLLPLLLAIVGKAYGQQLTLTGTAVDTAGAPIPSATVLLLAADTVAAASITTLQGAFSLPFLQPGLFTLSVSCVGYGTGSMLLSLRADTALAPITLQSSLMLDAVSVTGQRTQVAHSADRLSYVVSHRDRVRSSSAYKLLAHVPGLTVDPGQRTVAVAGAENTLVMVNGIKRNPSAIHSLNPKDVERVEVVSNPSAAHLSADITGVVNIITRQRIQGVQGSISQMATVPRLKQDGWTELALTHNSNALSLFGSAFYSYQNENRVKRRSTTETLVQGQPVTYREQSDTASSSLTPWIELDGGGEVYLSRRTTLLLNARFVTGESAERYSLQREQAMGAIPMGTQRLNVSDTSSEQEYKYTTYLKHLLPDSIGRIDVEVGYSGFRYTDEAATSLRSPWGAARYSLYSNSRKYACNAQVECTHFIHGQELSGGYRFYYQDVQQQLDDKEQGGQNLTDYNEQKHYLYLSTKGKLQPKLSYSLGMGAEHTAIGISPSGHAAVSNSYTKLLPSISFVQQLARLSTVRASYMASLRRIPVAMLNPTPIILDSLNYGAGNPSLKPYLRHRVAVGYAYSSGAFYVSPQLTCSVEPHRVVQVGGLMPGIGTYRYSYAPVASYKHFSAEVAVKWSITDSWELNGTLAWAYAQFANSQSQQKRSHSYPSYGFSTSYYFGTLSISARMLYSGDYLDGDNISASPFDSSLSAEWELGERWALGLELRYFTPWRITSTTRSNGYYSHKEITRHDRYFTPFMSITYSFDRGTNRSRAEKRIEYYDSNEGMKL